MQRFHLSAIVITVCLLFVSQALALDGYRDRRGLFYGVGFGGGQTTSDIDGADSHIGYNFRARIGGGVDQTLTLDAEIGLNSVNYSQAGVNVEQGVTTVAVGANVFIEQGLYIRFQGGIAELSVHLDDSAEGAETGLFFASGAGYEFFANADLAIGLGVDFQHQMYDDQNLSALNLGITANWY